MKRRITALTTLTAALLSLPTKAVDDDFIRGGHLKYRLEHLRYNKDDFPALSSDRNLTYHIVNGRVLSNYSRNGFQFNLHIDMAAIREPASAPLHLDNDAHQVMNLFHRSRIDDTHSYLARVDRFNLVYVGDRATVKAGRQTLTWGNGLLFQPMDIFNPFSPVATDKEYKSGDDMLYAQLQLSEATDIQMVAVPRRNSAGSLARRDSSLAWKSHTLLEKMEVDFLLATHYEDHVLAMGLNASLAQSVFRFDIASTKLRNNGHRTSAVANLDYSWQWLEHNVYGFIEVYHNGFGLDDMSDPIPPSLSQRLSRMELFSRGKNYLAGGLQIELHPLWLLSPTAIINSNDESILTTTTVSYNWLQNLTLQMNLIAPFGAEGTEYGTPNTTGRNLLLMGSFYF